jgi:hypothetical protein
MAVLPEMTRGHRCASGSVVAEKRHLPFRRRSPVGAGGYISPGIRADLTGLLDSKQPIAASGTAKANFSTHQGV